MVDAWKIGDYLEVFNSTCFTRWTQLPAQATLPTIKLRLAEKTIDEAVLEAEAGDMESMRDACIRCVVLNAPLW